MTEQLRTALREVADDVPPFDLTADPWRRGRRARRRRKVAAVAALAVVAIGVGGLASNLPGMTSATVQPADEAPVEPTLPDQLLEVPRNLPDISDDPLGGPAVIVYPTEVSTGWFSGAPRPVVVGAEPGQARAIRVAGDLGPFAHTVPAPDGTKLALANERRGDEPPTVVVIDLVTGETSRYTLPDEDLLGGVSRLIWTPDGNAIAAELLVTTSRSSSGAAAGGEVAVVLDLSEGRWLDRPARSTPYAFSPDGRHEVRWSADASGLVVGEVDGPDMVPLPVDTGGGLAFSPDSSQIAAITWPSEGYSALEAPSIELFDAATGDSAGSVELGEFQDAVLLGWGAAGVVVASTLREETVVERVDVTDLADASRATILTPKLQVDGGQIEVPQAFLDADVRPAVRPEAPFDWTMALQWLFLLGVMTLVAIASERSRRRRLARRKSG